MYKSLYAEEEEEKRRMAKNSKLIPTIYPGQSN